MGNHTKQIKELKIAKNKAIRERDEAWSARNRAVAYAEEVGKNWAAFEGFLGGNPEEIKNRILQAYERIVDEECRLLEARGEFLEEKETNLLEISQAQKRFDASVEKVNKAIEEGNKALFEFEKKLLEKEAELKEKEESISKREERADVKKARRRLRKKSQEAENLYKECKRLTEEVVSLNRQLGPALEAVQYFGERFNVKTELDIYRGIPTYHKVGHTIEIPPGGCVLEFLDEEIEITPQDFGGERFIVFEHFAHVVNNRKKPERWRVGLKDDSVALFTRGLFKITKMNLFAPEPKKEEEVEVEEPEEVEPTPKALTKIKAAKFGDVSLNKDGSFGISGIIEKKEEFRK